MNVDGFEVEEGVESFEEEDQGQVDQGKPPY
jgi:hypothetical protein